MVDFDELNEALAKVIEDWTICWEEFCEAVKTFATLFTKLKEYVYEGTSNPPAKYASRIKKNHLYRDRKACVYQVNRKPKKYQPYYRRVFM